MTLVSCVISLAVASLQIELAFFLPVQLPIASQHLRKKNLYKLLGTLHSTFTLSNECFHFTCAEGLQLLQCFTTAVIVTIWALKRKDK